MTPTLTVVLIIAVAALLLIAFLLWSRRRWEQGPLPEMTKTAGPLEAAGTIVNAANGFPLGGLHVLIRLGEPEVGSSGLDRGAVNNRGGVLCEAVSDSRGMFRIVFTPPSPDDKTPDRIAEPASMRSLTLEVRDPTGPVLLSQPFSSGLSASLRVELPARPITTAHWAEVGARMKNARIARLNELTRSLISVSPVRARFGDWDVATRHTVLGALETAFLDPSGALSALGAPPPGFLALRDGAKLEAYRQRIEPHLTDASVSKAYSEMLGKVMSFPDLASVDWVIDPNDLESGNTGGALGKFQDGYKVKKWEAQVYQPLDPELLDRWTTIDTAPPLPPDEPALIPYRDYLLKVYVDPVAVAKQRRQEPFTPQDDDASVSLLEKRFKQNFRTQNLEERWANGLLIPIITDVLTSPPGGGYGFGVPAEQLDPQGARTNRQYSMARDFPLAFGRLKKTGRCEFQTFESSFRDVYPGTYGYRIIAVTLAVSSTGPVSPLRALLTNEGFSLISRQSGDQPHFSLRPRDALPLSEFRLRDDMTVYGLPGEALMPFEGSGVETAWALEVSFAGNPYGLDTTADILLTFDVRAYYSYGLHQKTRPPSSVSRIVLVSAARHLAKSLADLRGKATQVVLDFDLATIGLPAREANRKVTNAVIFLAANKPPSFNATVSVAGADPNRPETTGTEVSFTGGIAFANAPPQSDGSPALPLNSFVGETMEQIFRVKIDKSENPGADFSGVSDVVLGLEYHGDISS